MRHAADALKEIKAVDIGLLCFIVRILLFVWCLILYIAYKVDFYKLKMIGRTYR